MHPAHPNDPSEGVLGWWRYLPKVSGGLVGGIMVVMVVECVFEHVLLVKASVFTFFCLSLRANALGKLTRHEA